MGGWGESRRGQTRCGRWLGRAAGIKASGNGTKSCISAGPDAIEEGPVHSTTHGGPGTEARARGRGPRTPTFRKSRVALWIGTARGLPQHRPPSENSAPCFRARRSHADSKRHAQHWSRHAFRGGKRTPGVSSPPCHGLARQQRFARDPCPATGGASARTGASSSSSMPSHHTRRICGSSLLALEHSSVSTTTTWDPTTEGRLAETGRRALV